MKMKKKNCGRLYRKWKMRCKCTQPANALWYSMQAKLTMVMGQTVRSSVISNPSVKGCQGINHQPLMPPGLFEKLTRIVIDETGTPSLENDHNLGCSDNIEHECTLQGHA